MQRQEQSLQDKRVLITGGTTGIGRAIALAFANDGARIATFGRHRQELDDAMELLRPRTAHAVGMVADAAKAEDVKRVFETIDQELGGLDLLIANAAIAAGGLDDCPEEDWRYAIEANLAGYLACAKEASERFKANGGGDIVFIGSISANGREEGSSVYVASKAAIQGFAEAFGKEAATKGIRVSLVEPGAVGSDMREESVEEQRAKIEKDEMLMAEDIADCVRFLVTRPRRVNLQSMRVIPRLQHQAE